MKRLAAFLAAAALLFSSSAFASECKDLMQFMDNYFYARLTYTTGYKNYDINTLALANGMDFNRSIDPKTGNELRIMYYEGGTVTVNMKTLGVQSASVEIMTYEDGNPSVDIDKSIAMIYALENNSIKYIDTSSLSNEARAWAKENGIFSSAIDAALDIMKKCVDANKILDVKEKGKTYICSTDNYEYYLQYISGLPVIKEGKKTGATYETISICAVAK